MPHAIYLIWYSFVFGCFSTVKADSTEPLTFQYDKFNSRTVLIRAKTDFDTQQIDYRTVTKDKYGTKIYSQWSNLVKSNGTPLEQFPWSKPDGICAEYELRSTLSGNKTVIQNLTMPPLELSSESKMRAAQIQYLPNGDITVTVGYGTEVDYWAGSGARYTSVEPFLKPANCQIIFQQYPPPPQILNGGHLLVFSVQYAYSNCTFSYGLNITLDIPTDHCVQNFITNETQSLTINLSCSTVPNLHCSSPKRECAMDCSPLEIKSIVTNDDPRNHIPSKGAEYLVVRWTFSDATEASTDHYRIRYSQAHLTDWNTLTNETDSVKIDEFKNKFLEIRPNNSVNYTFQICAVLTSGCQHEVDWTKEKRYKISYKKGIAEKSKDSVQKPSPISAHPRGSGSITKRHLKLTFVISALYFVNVVLYFCM